MSAIFPYVGFNYSSSAPCLGGLPILRSLENCTGTGTGTGTTNRQDLLKEQDNSNVAGVVVDTTDCRPDKQAVTKASLEASAEVAQADTKHNEGKRRLDEQINSSSFGTRNKVAMRILTIGAVLALLPGCILGPYSEKGPNTGSPQTQGIVKSEELHNLLRASEVPREVNGRNVSMNLPHVTTEPEKLEK
jgi:hypothetical protein